jgi:tetrapyrrole methylase family protein/MazG family protein
MTLTLIGLCGGGRESLTLGALDALRKQGRCAECLVIARTRANETMAWLESSEGGVAFDKVFDLPYPCDPSDASAISEAILAEARRRDVVYLVPGHPVLEERASTQIYVTARAEGLPLNVIALDPEVTRAGVSDFGSLVDVMSRLRHPETGCPWDKEQSHETLRRYLIEEAYEVIEAIDSGNPDKISEELGDFMLQAVFHAQLGREAGAFDIGDSILAIVEKLIRRHPHVFGEVSVEGSDEVLRNWEQIKRAEKGYEDRKSVLDGIPKDLPALMRALEVSKRVVKVGFEWPTVSEVLDKVEEEIAELRAEIAVGDTRRAEAEMGDLLFTLVNVSRQLKIDPEEALRAMTHRFGARFRHIEAHAATTGRTVDQLPLEEMEEVWQAAKRHAPDGGAPQATE